MVLAKSWKTHKPWFKIFNPDILVALVSDCGSYVPGWSSLVPDLLFELDLLVWKILLFFKYIKVLVFFYLASWKILSNWTEQSQSPEYRWWYHRSQISRNTTEACDGRFWLWISETGIKVVQTKRSTHQTWFRESKKRICQRINVQMWTFLRNRGEYLSKSVFLHFFKVFPIASCSLAVVWQLQEAAVQLLSWSSSRVVCSRYAKVPSSPSSSSSSSSSSRAGKVLRQC